MLGGVCVNTGTIPSKTLREAILYFSGFKQKSFYGRAYTLKEVTMADLTSRVRTVIQREKEVIKLQLERNRGIALLDGYARFVDQHTIVVENPITETKRTIRGKNILIACGTRPAHSPKIPCDGKYILDSDQILRIDTLPRYCFFFLFVFLLKENQRHML
jgi:NAD(P) transhydrogenase